MSLFLSKMENYERYKNINSKKYEKKGIMYYLCRKPSDNKIFPIINNIKDKKVLEVGIGTGYYTKILLKNKCNVTGVDINPHLGKKLGIKIIKAKADNFSKNLKKEKFDIVSSFWMTEYLNEKQLEDFLKESRKVLKKDGKLITTIITNKGLGWLYIFLAKRLKNINKYNYSKKQIANYLKNQELNSVHIIKLNSWLSIPWAFLVVTK